MILGRRGLKTLPQDMIARSLGLILPPNLHSRYPWVCVSNQESEWGVHPQADGSTIDRFPEDMRIFSKTCAVPCIIPLWQATISARETLLLFFPTI
jgi:hypothetical protein